MEYFRRAFADSRTTALTVGLGTVIVSHTAMVVNLLPGAWNEYQKQNHAAINLASAGLILYGSGVVG
jgi:hypothetical protein